ncbi:MAG: FtsQ-type POTRA domain-containing protein [Clostridia bacterium]|nr:FtsQ-type POTRA domain-containing protein [Clostridia bacterium]
MSEYEEPSAYKSKSKRKKKKRRKKRPFLTLFIIVLVIVGAVLLLKSALFNVTDIRVEGNKYYTPSQVIELSGIETGKNLIFDVKPRAAVKNLLQSAYIKNAKVEKMPMGTVVIKLEERVEYAAVESGGRYVIIDTEGTVLRTADEEPKITVLEGIALSSSEEGKPIKAEQSYMLASTLKILEETGKLDLYFKKIYFSSAVVKAYIYDHYYCEGTPDGILSALPAIKRLAEEHFKQDINKGVIKIGTGGELFFDPRID